MAQNLKDSILQACSAKNIPEGESGLWSVYKLHVANETTAWKGDKEEILHPGIYTYLRRYTMETAHRKPPGEIVMEDTIQELKTHLNFMLMAHGKVLVTGLGLGCVVRGLLVNPMVESVTCVEKSRNVLRLVLPHMSFDRLTVIHADALEWVKTNREKFDCAYHDLWTNQEEGEPHLALWHRQLLRDCSRKVHMQGAWAFPKSMKRVYGRYINLI